MNLAYLGKGGSTEMSAWYPNRRQWWTIWITYGFTVLVNVDSLNAKTDDEFALLTRFMVVFGTLWVWRFARTKAERAS